MRNKSVATGLRRLVSTARFEVLPTASCEDAVLASLPAGRTVTVTASPSKGLESTLALTERLAAAGYDAVPHLAARMISGRIELGEICERLRAARVSTIFVPAGDADPPAGDYRASLDLLRDLRELSAPFVEIGVTGYPESHPSIADDLTVQAMWHKRHVATHVVSNLTFDPTAVTIWIERMRARGITMPLRLGLPGPVDRTRLLLMATKIGVGESTKFLTKHRRTLTRLAAPGGFTGERFLERLAPVLTAPESLVAGLHVFTFNQIAETEAWRQALLLRLGAPSVE